LLSHALLMGHAFLRFLIQCPVHTFVSWSGSLFASRLSTARCRMLGCQVTNKQTGHDPLFLELLDCNKGTTHSGTLFSFSGNHGFDRNVLQEDDILCELYAETCSVVSDYSDSVCSDSDSDVPTTSSPKQLRSFTGPLTLQFPH
jgi:hypothetical protein